MNTFGQLDEIYKNRKILDTAFSNIGGTKLVTYLYWSSSEYNDLTAWYRDFNSPYTQTANNSGYKGNDCYRRVRFIRDIE